MCGINNSVFVISAALLFSSSPPSAGVVVPSEHGGDHYTQGGSFTESLSDSILLQSDIRVSSPVPDAQEDAPTVQLFDGVCFDIFAFLVGGTMFATARFAVYTRPSKANKNKTRSQQWRALFQPATSQRTQAGPPFNSTSTEGPKRRLAEETSRGPTKPEPPKYPADQSGRRAVCNILKSLQLGQDSVSIDGLLVALDEMEEVDDGLLSSALESAIRAQRTDIVSKLLQRQRKDENMVLSSQRTFGIIIRAYGIVGDTEGAEEVWRDMRGRKILPTSVTLGCMVEAVSCNGDPDRGHKLIREMLGCTETRSLVNAIIYGSVIKGYRNQKLFGKVWSIYNEMIGVGLRCQMTIVTYNTLIDACARCGEMTHAMELLERMSTQGIEPNRVTYSTVLKGFCLANRVQEAFDLLETMKQSEHLRPDEPVYNTLLDGCSRQRLFSPGLDLFREMKESGVPPTNFTLSVLVKLISRCGTIDDAFEACEATARQYRFELNHHVYANLVQACFTENRQEFDRAIGIAGIMVERRVKPDARFYTLLLRACVEANRVSDADGLLRAATGLGGIHPSLEGRDTALLQPRGGLPGEIVSEVIGNLACCRDGGEVAVRLFKDLRVARPSIRLNPRLMKLTAAVARGTRGGTPGQNGTSNGRA